MTRTIRVKTNDGEVEVAADVSGDYAIHRPAGGEKGWTITHVPTGFACRHVSTRAIARALRKLALKDYLLWWSLDRLVGSGKATVARVQDQATADERIPAMLNAAANGELRIIRCHPLLGAIDLGKWIGEYFCSQCYYRGFDCEYEDSDEEGVEQFCPKCGADEWYFTFAEFHGGLQDGERFPVQWVIVSGELGPDARPVNAKWVYDLRDQCQQAGVPFYFEGWGEWIPAPEISTFGPDPVAMERHGLSADEAPRGWNVRPEWREAIAGKPWGVVEYDGTFLPETTTWNGRQLSEEDEWEHTIYRVGHEQSGRLLDGREWLEMPEVLKESHDGN